MGKELTDFTARLRLGVLTRQNIDAVQSVVVIKA